MCGRSAGGAADEDGDDDGGCGHVRGDDQAAQDGAEERHLSEAQERDLLAIDGEGHAGGMGGGGDGGRRRGGDEARRHGGLEQRVAAATGGGASDGGGGSDGGGHGGSSRTWRRPVRCLTTSTNGDGPIDTCREDFP